LVRGVIHFAESKAPHVRVEMWGADTSGYEELVVRRFDTHDQPIQAVSAPGSRGGYVDYVVVRIPPRSGSNRLGPELGDLPRLDPYAVTEVVLTEGGGTLLSFSLDDTRNWRFVGGYITKQGTDVAVKASTRVNDTGIHRLSPSRLDAAVAQGRQIEAAGVADDPLSPMLPPAAFLH
jgi:hypothetical protein